MLNLTKEVRFVKKFILMPVLGAEVCRLVLDGKEDFVANFWDLDRFWSLEVKSSSGEGLLWNGAKGKVEHVEGVLGLDGEVGCVFRVGKV